MYSTPKCRASIVNNETSEEQISAKLSTQNVKWESIISKQKNHLPKSIKKYKPIVKIVNSSFNEKNKVEKKIIID